MRYRKVEKLDTSHVLFSTQLVVSYSKDNNCLEYVVRLLAYIPKPKNVLSTQNDMFYQDIQVEHKTDASLESIIDTLETKNWCSELLNTYSTDTQGICIIVLNHQLIPYKIHDNEYNALYRGKLEKNYYNMLVGSGYYE